MKMTVTLSKEEVKKAVENYLKEQGFINVENVRLNASNQYDFYDRPIGIDFADATADVEKV